MSVVRFHVPENRLTKLLRIPGGLPIAEAVVQADAGLAALEAPALEQLAEVLGATEAALERLPQERDEAALAELYRIAQGGIGLGSLCARPSVDIVLQSLCDLLDHLATRRLWDVEAIAVHVRALRLLMSGEGPGSGAVLQGLQKVSRRYAGPDGDAG